MVRSHETRCDLSAGIDARPNHVQPRARATNSGWLVGAGIEWALAPNWSVKIEYDYLGLNSQRFTAPAGGFLAGDSFTTSNPNVQMVKVGANYLFKYGVGGY